MSRKLAPPDQSARDRISSDLKTTLLVEAGAGSGKTTSLVTRFSELLRTGTATVDQIAAVTFTRKAAAELRERLQETLERSVAASKSGPERDRLQAALERVGEAMIGTIHSFCARLLRERPVEAGLDPGFTEVEEGESEQLLGFYWRDFLSEAHLAGNPDLDALGRIGIKPEELEELYGKLCMYRDVTPSMTDSPRPDMAPVRKALRKFLDTVHTSMPKTEPEKGWDGLQSAVRLARWKIRTFGIENDVALMDVLEEFGKAPGITQNRWPDPKAAKAIKEKDLTDFVDGIAAPAIQSWLEYRYPFCIRFTQAAVRYAAERRTLASIVDFGDLLLRARDLLSAHEAACAFFASRYTHILVDEFQDTDPVQAEILFRLAGDPVEKDNDWRKRKLRPGALFVVGDPKQSIYRFRRADIATYNLVKDLIRKSGGEVLSLSANFRSVNAIGEYVDGAFTGIFPKGPDKYQATFASLQTRRNGPSTLSGVFRHSTPGSGKDDVQEGASIHVASWIAWALGGNVLIEEKGESRAARPGDILVLTRTKKVLMRIAAALEERQVPYDLTGATGFNEAPEIVGTIRLLQCLADPENQVGIVSVLEDFLFGHSCKELHEFRKKGESIRIGGASERFADEEICSVGASLARMEELWRLTRDRSPSAAVASILDQVGLVSLVAASPLGATAAGRLYKLIEILRNAEGLNIADFASAVEWLAQAIEADIDPLSLMTGEADVVRVMNLHKAKGLEAPIVILGTPWQFGIFPPDCHVDRMSGPEGRGYFIVRKRKGEYAWKMLACPPGWQRFSAEEVQYQQAEENRLLYVAATRAAQILIITDAPGISRGRNPWELLARNAKNDLSMEGVDLSAGNRRKRSIPTEKIDGALIGVRQGIQAGAIERLRRVGTTDLTKQGDRPKATKGTAGKGAAWGKVMHRCFELAGRGEVITKAVAAAIISEAGRQVEEIDEVLAEMKSFQSTAFWKRIAESPERYTEVPFLLPTDGKCIGLDAGLVHLEGVIDLVFREGEEWVLVDYKTDFIDGDAAPLVDYYAPQVRIYSAAWQKLTDRPVKAAYLLFTHQKEACEVALEST